MTLRHAVAALLLAAPVASYAATAWTTDTGASTLTYSTAADGEPFTGNFKSFDAKIVFDPADLAGSSFDVSIDLASADSGNSDRDDTLQGEEFFNTAKHAKAHFKAKEFVPGAGAGKYTANGTLELNGVTRPVALIFTWTGDAAKATLVGESILKRLDFNVGTGDWADDSTITHEVVVKTSLQLSAGQ